MVKGIFGGISVGSRLVACGGIDLFYWSLTLVTFSCSLWKGNGWSPWSWRIEDTEIFILCSIWKMICIARHYGIVSCSWQKSASFICQLNLPKISSNCKLNIMEFNNAQHLDWKAAFSDSPARREASLALFSVCLMEMPRQVADVSPLIDQYCVAFHLVSLSGWYSRIICFSPWKTALYRLPGRKRKWEKSYSSPLTFQCHERWILLTVWASYGEVFNVPDCLVIQQENVILNKL